MSDIFLSYSRADTESVRYLVDSLQKRGWSVFWDRNVPIGEAWRSYIGEKLSQSRCVIVVWSQASISSQWVLEEAEEAKRRGVLFPISLDGTAPPFGFGNIQCAKLKDSDEDEGKKIEDIADKVAVYLAGKTNAKKQPLGPARSPSPVESETRKQKSLQGIGGWLFLPVISLVGYFFLSIFELFNIYKRFASGKIDLFMTKEGEFYSPLWEVFISLNIVLYLSMFVGCSILLIYMFKRLRSFPVLMVSFYLLVISIHIVEAVSAQFLLTQTTIDIALEERNMALSHLAGAILAALVWIPYFLISKRVKNTFTK